MLFSFFWLCICWNVIWWVFTLHSHPHPRRKVDIFLCGISCCCATWSWMDMTKMKIMLWILQKDRQRVRGIVRDNRKGRKCLIRKFSQQYRIPNAQEMLTAKHHHVWQSNIRGNSHHHCYSDGKEIILIYISFRSDPRKTTCYECWKINGIIFMTNTKWEFILLTSHTPKRTLTVQLPRLTTWSSKMLKTIAP